jgi:hypothetical protein
MQEITSKPVHVEAQRLAATVNGWGDELATSALPPVLAPATKLIVVTV